MEAFDAAIATQTTILTIMRQDMGKLHVRPYARWGDDNDDDKTAYDEQ